MGVRKRRPRKFRKRKRARRGGTRRRRHLPLTGFPKLKVVKLRYVQEITLTSVAGGLSHARAFSANGLHDPDHALGGHQPKGFDQWMSLYAHYNVLGSKCRMRAAGTGSDAFCWGVARTAAPGEMDAKTLPFILECRMNKGYAVSGGYQRSNSMNTASVKSSTYSQKKQFGPNSTGRDSLRGQSGANPAEDIMFEPWICPSGGALAAVVTGKFIITIDYIVLFSEQRVLSQS